MPLFQALFEESMNVTVLHILDAVEAVPLYATAAVGCIGIGALVPLLRRCLQGRPSEDLRCSEEFVHILAEIHFYAGESPEKNCTKQCIDLLTQHPHMLNKPISGDLSHGYTPFLRACWNNNFELISYMMAHGADIRLTNSDGETALYLVAYRVSKSPNWDPRALNLLWDNGCSVDDVNVHNNTMLHLAAKAGNTTLARWLMLHGAEPNVVNSLGFTPRSLALRKGTPAHKLVAELVLIPIMSQRCKYVRRPDGMEIERSHTEPLDQ